MRLFTVVSNSFRSGGGGDVTPTPTPNWTETGTYSGETDIVQIQGISQAITLQLTWSDTNLLEVGVQTGATTALGTQVNLATNGTFSISPNYYVKFVIASNNTVTFEATVTVKNVSDNNTVLDTFTLGYLDV